MKLNFKKVAQNSVSISPIMAGREKVSTEEIIGKDLTVLEFDIATIENFKNRQTGAMGTVEYAVYVFAEMPGFYYQSGTVGTRIAKDWLALYEGESVDIHDQCAELSREIAAENIMFRFSNAQTSQGNRVIKIDVL